MIPNKKGTDAAHYITASVHYLHYNISDSDTPIKEKKR